MGSAAGSLVGSGPLGRVSTAGSLAGAGRDAGKGEIGNGSGGKTIIGLVVAAASASTGWVDAGGRGLRGRCTTAFLSLLTSARAEPAQFVSAYSAMTKR